MKTKVLELLVEGVRVRLDEQGRPLTVSTAAWLGDDRERIARLALNVAEMRLRRAADRRRKAADDATRTAESAKSRRKNARKHWFGEWLQAAHNAHPEYGAERLAQAARHTIAMNGKEKPEFAKRHQVTKYRAQQYLTKRAASS